AAHPPPDRAGGLLLGPAGPYDPGERRRLYPGLPAPPGGPAGADAAAGTGGPAAGAQRGALPPLLGGHGLRPGGHRAGLRQDPPQVQGAQVALYEQDPLLLAPEGPPHPLGGGGRGPARRGSPGPEAPGEGGGRPGPLRGAA